MSILLLKACNGVFEILPDLEICFLHVYVIWVLHLYSSRQNTFQRQIFVNGVTVIIHVLSYNVLSMIRGRSSAAKV